MSREGEKIEGEDSPGESSAVGGASDLGGPSSAGTGLVAPVLLDARVLASILNQAKGPILSRIRQATPQFTGDGSVDVTAWIREFEGLCEVEQIAPTEILIYMLGGNAARVYSRMCVGEASQWDVVKAALVAEYAMPRQEAWRRFITCRMEDGNTVDVYLDHLERFGGRVGMTCNDLSFRAQFYEGLPASVYEWAVTLESAYKADFGSVLARVRERVVSCRAVARRSRSGQQPGEVAAASERAQQQSGASSCYRCGGAHRVKDCTESRRASSNKWLVRNSSGKRAGCFRCGGIDHWVQDCPKPPAVAAGLEGNQPGFQAEDGTRGAASSNMDTTV